MGALFISQAVLFSMLKEGKANLKTNMLTK